MSRRLLAPVMTALCLLAAGCDQLGIESASAIAARKEADGKAIGGACRHAARAIEDCYVLNRRADRAAIYAGWREMNEYMRENKPRMPPADSGFMIIICAVSGCRSAASIGMPCA